MADEVPDGRRALRGDSLVGVTQVARELGLGRRTVRRAITTGELPSYAFGHRQKLRVADVRCWIEKHRRR
jgi:excisionase family DNA binding protein